MSTERTPPLAVALMTAAVVATIGLVAFVLAYGLPGGSRSVVPAPAIALRADLETELGVQARITAGDVTIDRTFPSLNFALHPGQSLDARLPAGPFKAEFAVTFLAGQVREATIGAVFQGGSMILRRGDRPPLLADHAGHEARTVMTVQPEFFSRQPQIMSFTFESDGTSACRLRAIWKPGDSQVALPLPSAGEAILGHAELRGKMLMQQFNCAACHHSTDAQLQATLSVNPSPNLGDIGARVRPEWLRSWLENPSAVNPRASMPRVFHGGEDDREEIEDLTSFLVSLGGPVPAAPSPLDPDLASTGMVTYHSVGCVACHGPLKLLENLPGLRPTIAKPFRSYHGFSRIADKTTAEELAKFLYDPLTHWPGGRMPSMKLSELEAEGLAHYLLQVDARKNPPVEFQAYELDSLRVARGRSLFASKGCINCHDLGANREAIASTVTAPAIEALTSDTWDRGCLSEDAHASTPRFSLSDGQRASIISFLQGVPLLRCHDTPIDELAVTMARLDCLACHQYFDENGPETAISQYFTAVEEADLGDEGRLPPDLSDVGARLNPAAIARMLDGQMTARPYMGTRMPDFGRNNTDHLPACFAAAAGTMAVPDHGPTLASQSASIGRELVGSKGMNCIQCHDVSGRPSTGTPGPDLALMSERLRYEAFARWLHDPSEVRPGTRMPSFFVSGVSGFPQHLDGEADAQIEAIWAYLSQGEFMPLPEGLTDAATMGLQPTDRPIVFRSFLTQGGVRAIACGYHERIHCSFDAERCRLTAIWTGDFINASGAWAARGGTLTNPKDLAWKSDDRSLFQISAPDLATVPSEPLTVSFKGYRLDAEGRPSFTYELRQGMISIQVSEQPLPELRLSGPVMRRNFTFQGPASQSFMMRTDDMTVTDADVNGRHESHGDWTTIHFDESGKASISLEVTW